MYNYRFIYAYVNVCWIGTAKKIQVTFSASLSHFAVNFMQEILMANRCKETVWVHNFIADSLSLDMFDLKLYFNLSIPKIVQLHLHSNNKKG